MTGRLRNAWRWPRISHAATTLAVALLLLLAPQLTLWSWLNGAHATPEQASLHEALRLRYGDRDHHHLRSPGLDLQAMSGVTENRPEVDPAKGMALRVADDLLTVFFAVIQGLLLPAALCLTLALTVVCGLRTCTSLLRSHALGLDPPPPRTPFAT